jgi:hypothetical protein
MRGRRYHKASGAAVWKAIGPALRARQPVQPPRRLLALTDLGQPAVISGRSRKFHLVHLERIRLSVDSAKRQVAS